MYVLMIVATSPEDVVGVPVDSRLLPEYT